MNVKKLKLNILFYVYFLLAWVVNALQSFKTFFLVAFAARISTADLVNRCFYFCEVSTGRTMFPYQEQFAKRVIRSVLENDGEEITALFSRQSGKSETLAVVSTGLMIILPQLANMPMFADDSRLKMFKDGLWIGIFAPSQRQAQTTYGKIRARIQSNYATVILQDPEFNLEFTTSNGQTVALSNGSFVTAMSASEGANIEGESFKLIICEEAQDISNFKITKSIHPMGAAYNATIVKIGTATTFKGNFFNAIQRNKRDDKLRKSHIRNHFEYDYIVASKYNPKYAKYVEKEKHRLGESSDEFRMSYKLQWIIERSMFVDIVKFEKNNLEFGLDRIMQDRQNNHVVGIDVGGKGDSTIVTVCEVDWNQPVIMESRTNEETGEDETYMAYNTYVVDWYNISDVPDYEEQYAMIMDYLSHFSVARVMIDATREAGLAHRLNANLSCEVVPFIFTTKSKSELYKHLDREITSGRARVCGSDSVIESREYQEFSQQLGDLQKGYNGTHMTVSHPEVKGAHDDYPDSWALAVYGCSFEGEKNETETRKNRFTARTKNEEKFSRRVQSLTARRR